LLPYGPRWIHKWQRVPFEKSNSSEPFERAWHWDDWLGLEAHKYADFDRRPCVRDVPAKSGKVCKFISHRLCDHQSKSMPALSEALSGDFRQCMAPRETCAVVGSSRNLLNASWGGLIDKHDVVIRMNSAPAGRRQSPKSAPRTNDMFSADELEKMAQHAGSRTDVRFLNQMGILPQVEERVTKANCLFLHAPYIPQECGDKCIHHPGMCNISCQIPGVTPEICTRTKCRLKKLRCMGADMTEDKDWGARTVFMDNFYGAVADQVVPRATTGFMAVLYALSRCKKVSVFGFGPDCYGGEGTRYYSNDVPLSPMHRYSEELMLLMRADTLGPKVLVPPEARRWINQAESIKVMLPHCVTPEQRKHISTLVEPSGL